MGRKNKFREAKIRATDEALSALPRAHSSAKTRPRLVETCTDSNTSIKFESIAIFTSRCAHRRTGAAGCAAAPLSGDSWTSSGLPCPLPGGATLGKRLD